MLSLDARWRKISSFPSRKRRSPAKLSIAPGALPRGFNSETPCSEFGGRRFQNRRNKLDVVERLAIFPIFCVLRNIPESRLSIRPAKPAIISTLLKDISQKANLLSYLTISITIHYNTRLDQRFAVKICRGRHRTQRRIRGGISIYF